MCCGGILMKGSARRSSVRQPHSRNFWLVKMPNGAALLAPKHRTRLSQGFGGSLRANRLAQPKHRRRGRLVAGEGGGGGRGRKPPHHPGRRLFHPFGQPPRSPPPPPASAAPPA